MTAVLNATMPEEYDDQHRIVSEKIYSNREVHLEEFMRIALFLLSNNRDVMFADNAIQTTLRSQTECQDEKPKRNGDVHRNFDC